MRLTARRAQAYAWMLLNTLAFGATIPIVKWGMGSTSPFRFLLYRFAIASVIAIPILWHYRGIIKRHKDRLLMSIGVELIGTTLALSILYFALNITTSLEANLILTTGPIFVTVGGLLILHERVTKREWLGLGLATSMTGLLSWLPFLTIGAMAALTGGNVFGNLLILVHNTINVIYSILAKKVYHHMPKMFATGISAMVGFITFSLISFGESGFNVTAFTNTITFELHNPIVWFVALFAAIVTTYIGLTAFFKGQDLIEVSEASLFVYLQPAVYIPISYVLLKESLQPLQAACFALVMVGVILAEWKPARLAKSKALSKKRRRL